MSIEAEEIAELQALMTGEPVETDDDPTMADEATATALLRALGECQRDAADVESLYEHFEQELQDKLAKLDERKAERLQPIRDRMASLERWLDGWHRAQVGEKNGKPTRLTIHLPTGTLKLAYQPPEITIDDADALMEWAKKAAPELITRPEPVYPPPRPDKTRVNMAAKAKLAEKDLADGAEGAGMLLPGVIVYVKPRKFTATPDI